MAIMNPSVYSPLMSPSAGTYCMSIPGFCFMILSITLMQSSPMIPGMHVVMTAILVCPSAMVSSNAFSRYFTPPNMETASSIMVHLMLCVGTVGKMSLSYNSTTALLLDVSMKYRQLSGPCSTTA